SSVRGHAPEVHIQVCAIGSEWDRRQLLFVDYCAPKSWRGAATPRRSSRKPRSGPMTGSLTQKPKRQFARFSRRLSFGQPKLAGPQVERMPGLITVLLFALATMILTVSPGPGVLCVAARSLDQGRAGFSLIFGIEFGEVVWIAAGSTRVATLLSTSIAAMSVLC